MLNHHSVTVMAPPDSIFKEMLLWGESEWWPDESPMRYTRLSGSTENVVGSRFLQKIHVPFGPQWEVELISATLLREVSWRFLNGMFSGVYRVYLIPAGGICELHFMMDYEVRGLINRLVWKSFSLKQHDRNIELILNSLKKYVEV